MSSYRRKGVTKERLRVMLDEGLSEEEIALRFGCTVTNVMYHLRKHGWSKGVSAPVLRCIVCGEVNPKKFNSASERCMDCLALERQLKREYIRDRLREDVK